MTKRRYTVAASGSADDNYSMRSNSWASLTLVLTATAGCFLFLGHAGDDDSMRPDSSSAACRSLSKFAGPANELLGNLPGVAEVEILVPAERPTHRIVHIADW